MAKDSKLLDRFYKHKYAKVCNPDPSFSLDITQEQLTEYIDKAIKLVKVSQYHSGFPEIFSHDLRGHIHVAINQDPERPDLFDIHFKFIILPGGTTLFKEQKIISFTELQRLANEYEKNKDRIEEELARRDELVR